MQRATARVSCVSSEYPQHLPPTNFSHETKSFTGKRNGGLYPFVGFRNSVGQPRASPTVLQSSAPSNLSRDGTPLRLAGCSGSSSNKFICVMMIPFFSLITGLPQNYSRPSKYLPGNTLLNKHQQADSL